ncbi:2-hydroxyacyl-CoA dehydratase [Microbacterium sp. NEAU-LLC]|uniref:2-hydroxyacyl-CoA dehydratase n=1 Tax=Microbacterium helvum TaxID=2773713 RepID=A0ABR8NQW0_9MICO|nr:2-hydroxyacyl-CoA dehydratase family protein [Microbacterium helvum]MBD3943036.1 2-hydroxyacyl-CoA dehydratase [Microbacterium helvum]
MSGLDGSATIGVIGADLPRQLVLAAGAVPRRLLGSWRPAVTPEAAELLGAVDIVAAGLLTELLGGRHDDLAGLVVCNDSAAHLRLFYLLRELGDRGRLPFPVQLLDVPPGADGPRAAFARDQYRRVADYCAAATGRGIDEASLRKAAAAESLVGLARERMRARRRAGRCTGVQALSAYRASLTEAPEQATAELDAATVEQAHDRLPVLVSGSFHPDATLYALLEESGLTVVADDHDTGDAAWLGDAVEADAVDDLIEGMLVQQRRRPPLSPRALAAERAQASAAAAEAAGAVAVLSLARELDDAPTWDAAALRRTLEPRGIPVVTAWRLQPQGLTEAVRAAAVAVRAEAAAAGAGR